MKSFDVQAAKRAGASDYQIKSFMDQNRLIPKKTLGGFAGNVVKSAGRTVGDIGSAAINVFNPDLNKNTIANIDKTVLGAAQLLIPGEQGYENNARAVGNFYKDRYGGLDNIKNTLYNDPVGSALDASVVLGGAGAVAKGVGTASKVSGLTRAGETLSTASRFADPLALAGRGISKVAGNAFRKAGPTLATESERVLTRGLGQPQQLKKVGQIAGRPTGKLIADYNIFERTPEAVRGAIDDVSNAYGKKLVESGKNIQTGDLLKALDDQIAILEKKSLISETAMSEMKSLIERRNNLEKYLSSPEGAVALDITPTSAVDIKRNIYKDVNPSTFNPTYSGSGSQLSAKSTYQQLIKELEKAAPGTKQLGRDEAALIKLEDIIKNSQSRGNARQMLNFSKLGGGAIGGVLAGAPGAIAGFAAEQVANSPQFLKGLSKTLDYGADFSKNVGKSQKLNTLNTGAGNIYKAGKYGQFADPLDEEVKKELERRGITPPTPPVFISR